MVRQHSVLHVDLIGACYDILTKPIPLMQRHVDIFRHKVIMGIHSRKKAPRFEAEGTEEAKNFEDDLEINANEIPIDDPNQVVMHKEMLQEMWSERRDVRIVEDFLDFNFAEFGRLSETKNLTVQNGFPFEVKVNWVLLQVESKKAGELVDNPFRISPAQQIIPPNSSFAFQVRFGPYEPDSYFFQTAQCFVQLFNGTENKLRKLETQAKFSNLTGSNSMRKSLMGTTRKTNKFEDALNEEIDPPLCLALRMVGHSFPPGSQPFIPMVRVSPSNKVAFLPCGPGEASYQTVQILNTSDTPVYYKLLQDPTKTFRAFPPQGLIPGKSFSLVCFEFSPKQARTFNFTAQCIFNHQSSNIQNIHLSASSYLPQLRLGNQGKLFFPPTFVGVSSKQRLSVKNESRIPLDIEWKVPEKYKAAIIFEPQRMALKPNEEVKIGATFTPLKRKEYLISVPLYALNMYDHAKDSIGFYNPGSGVQKALQNVQKDIQRYDFEIVGAGSDGFVQIEPKHIDFGTITVGFAKTLSIQIKNKSSANLYVELRMAQKPQEGKELPIMSKSHQDCFKFDHPKGMVNAKSKMKVNITFKPTVSFDFNIQLVVVAKEKIAKETLDVTQGNP